MFHIYIYVYMCVYMLLQTAHQNQRLLSSHNARFAHEKQHPPLGPP